MEDALMPFEEIDHTADTGIRVWAPGLPQLIEEAARGMTAQITDPERIDPVSVGTITVDGIDETDLLINTLRDLLYLFTGQGKLIRELVIESVDDSAAGGPVMNGRIRYELFHSRKHPVHTELKAVTYAGGDILKTPDGLEAVIIFDI